jgi:hypothetical protein
MAVIETNTGDERPGADAQKRGETQSDHQMPDEADGVVSANARPDHGGITGLGI